MKDYSMNLEERKDFVLDYDITDDGKIMVNYADSKESWPLPYNETNENSLLKKMKEQVLNANLDDLRAERLTFITSSFILILLTLFFGVKSVLSFNVYFLGTTCLGSAASLCSLVAYAKANSKLKDLEKNKRFLKVEEELNKSIMENHNALANVSARTKKVISDLEDSDRPIFNINSFNHVPFSDIEQIMDNVRRNQAFGFDYTESTTENKGKIREKRR